MKKFVPFILGALLLSGCKEKKRTLSGDEPVQIEDFINSFPVLELPYQLTDTMVARKEKDSLLISNKIFFQFVPDSIFGKPIGKNGTRKIYPLGRIEVSEEEKYLLIKTIIQDKKAGYILCFDGNNQFAGNLRFLELDADPTTRQVSSIDKAFSIHKGVFRRNADGSISDGKEVYAFNKDSRQFMLFMTDALDEKITDMINPIDTMPRRNKFSGDYTVDKKNIVSIRDGKNSDRFSFFVHLEKNRGDCRGELKGEAMFTGPSRAVYRLPGDPCVLQFLFTLNAVTLKEEEGCGSRRGLKCSFDGKYPKKKEAKPKTTKKKTTAK